MKYTVEWEEWVYDERSELDGIDKKKPFTVEANSFRQAIPLAKEKASSLAEEDHSNSEQSMALFVPEIIALTDENSVRRLWQELQGVKITVEWQEWVYDASDELEIISDKTPFVIEADSLSQAMASAAEKAFSIIKEERPDQSQGTFISRIIAFTDGNGIRHQLQKRQKVLNGCAVGDE